MKNQTEKIGGKLSKNYPYFFPKKDEIFTMKIGPLSKIVTKMSKFCVSKRVSNKKAATN